MYSNPEIIIIWMDLKGKSIDVAMVATKMLPLYKISKTFLLLILLVLRYISIILYILYRQ